MADVTPINLGEWAEDTTLSTTDPFELQLIKMVKTNRKKRTDYARKDNVFSNFAESSSHVGGTPGLSVEVLIATKQSRLRNLLHKLWGGEGNVENEPIEDTLLDRAVYSVIAMAIYEAGGY